MKEIQFISPRDALQGSLSKEMSPASFKTRFWSQGPQFDSTRQQTQWKQIKMLAYLALVGMARFVYN